MTPFIQAAPEAVLWLLIGALAWMTYRARQRVKDLEMALMARDALIGTTHRGSQGNTYFLTGGDTLSVSGSPAVIRFLSSAEVEIIP